MPQDLRESVDKKFDEMFSTLCLVNKFNEKKYWKPDACGYDPKDVEAPLDKFFPEKISAVCKSFLSSTAFPMFIEWMLKYLTDKIDDPVQYMRIHSELTLISRLQANKTDK